MLNFFIVNFWKLSSLTQVQHIAQEPSRARNINTIFTTALLAVLSKVHSLTFSPSDTRQSLLQASHNLIMERMVHTPKVQTVGHAPITVVCCLLFTRPPMIIYFEDIPAVHYMTSLSLRGKETNFKCSLSVFSFSWYPGLVNSCYWRH